MSFATKDRFYWGQRRRCNACDKLLYMHNKIPVNKDMLVTLDFEDKLSFHGYM